VGGEVVGAAVVGGAVVGGAVVTGGLEVDAPLALEQLAMTIDATATAEIQCFMVSPPLCPPGRTRQ
jgi:hypothetical protein